MTSAARSSAEVALEVRSLGKHYPGGRVALAGVDLEAAKGEILGLLGPNGAGKTTLVGCCTTRLRPTTGTVQVAGIDVARRPADAKRQIGVVTQYGNLDRSLRVGEIVYWHCRYFNFGRASARARSAELLALLALADRRRDAVASLSGGLARRVQLACSIAHGPEVLFLDEPTTGLDTETRHALWGLIREIADRGTTVLLTTHYLEEADRLCSRLAVINDGAIVAEGTPSQLRDRVGANTLIELILDESAENAAARVARLPGVTRARADGNRVQVFAMNRDHLIAEVSQATLPYGLRDLAVNRPTLETVIADITKSTTEGRDE